VEFALENGVGELSGVASLFCVLAVDVVDGVEVGCEDCVGVELGAGLSKLFGKIGGVEVGEADELGVGWIDADVFGVGVIVGELEVRVSDFQYAWFGP
jgi:hypothetical protein